MIISILALLDSFLRMRDKADHEATAMMKAQFMSLWDGKYFLGNTTSSRLSAYIQVHCRREIAKVNCTGNG